MKLPIEDILKRLDRLEKAVFNTNKKDLIEDLEITVVSKPNKSKRSKKK